ncbi:MAG: NAD-dependent epimerase/dehydratase family protein [Bdellovibrionota bacterium]
MKKTILVTGGGGFVGKALVKELLKKGYEVRSLSRKRYEELEKLGVISCQGNIGDEYEKIKDFFLDVYAVFHVASKVDMWGRYNDFYKTNILGTKNIIKACKEHNIKYLIYTSSPSVITTDEGLENVKEDYPYPNKYDAYYPQTKAEAEKLIVSVGKEKSPLTIVLRPHLIWGPGDTNLIPTILKKARGGKVRKVGDGENIVDCSYIDDCVDAHILALEALEKNENLSSNIYFVTQDEPIKLWDFVNKILATFGEKPITKKVSKKLALSVASVLEIFSKIIPSSKPLFTRFLIVEMTTHHYFDITNTKKDLGYKPKVSINEGLKRVKASIEN